MIHEFITTQGRGEFHTIRHLEFNIPAKEVQKFDDSNAVNYYATQFVAEGFEIESFDDATERVEGLLGKDAARRFRGLVRKLRRQK